MDHLYHEELLELYRHPLNKKTIADATRKHREHNPLCGDMIELSIKLENDRVADIGFQGNGCVISDVGASLLTETAKGKTVSELRSITLDSMLEALNLKQLNPTRIRCATLAWEGLKKMLPEAFGAGADMDKRDAKR